LVHDAARPWVSATVIDRVIDGALEAGAAIPVVPVADTIKRVDGGLVEKTVSRQGLFRAQTPQAAGREALIAALETNPNATDEASALEAAGIRVKAVAGEEINRKITTVADLPPSLTMTTTGFGFDIHAFSSDSTRPLMLGGVRFDDAPGLDGHSDADVLLHALTDALLGTVGGGDIGQLFPNDDPLYKDADSAVFLRKAKTMVDEACGQIISVDVTLLAEIPKLNGRREEIQARISQELGIPQRRINIKATTMEGLGAIGRSEGIAAMATATVALPTTSHEE
jgi:2-C-methyl-D-erythritol 4-phosphate cytidylyltransferase/2-C-methyl-D-erythritol 2,4-cyclodiphosphate synthase